MAEDIGLPPTSGTRAGAAERFKREEGLCAIGPGDGEFLPDFLDIRGIKGLGHRVKKHIKKEVIEQSRKEAQYFTCLQGLPA